ncbi:MAG: hypothetical protein ACRC5M_06345 [Anaeroplasmataceae bacterium]
MLRKKNIQIHEYDKYKKRILSVLEIKKMFPVKSGVYEKVSLNINDLHIDKDELDRR